jgi:hypothetical protein
MGVPLQSPTNHMGFIVIRFMQWRRSGTNRSFMQTSCQQGDDRVDWFMQPIRVRPRDLRPMLSLRCPPTPIPRPTCTCVLLRAQRAGEPVKRDRTRPRTCRGLRARLGVSAGGTCVTPWGRGGEERGGAGGITWLEAGLLHGGLGGRYGDAGVLQVGLSDAALALAAGRPVGA